MPVALSVPDNDTVAHHYGRCIVLLLMLSDYMFCL